APPPPGRHRVAPSVAHDQSRSRPRAEPGLIGEVPLVTDSDQDREQVLMRRYRRLLLAYPRWHRRLHGPDQLTALLDLWAGGRRRPTGRDDLGLVLDGLRCRLRVRGAAAVILASMVS